MDMLWYQQTEIRANMYRMITMHARPRWTSGQTDGRTNIMAIARRFVLTNASRAKKTRKETWQWQTGYSPRPPTLSQRHADLRVWSYLWSSYMDIDSCLNNLGLLPPKRGSEIGSLWTAKEYLLLYANTDRFRKCFLPRIIWNLPNNKASGKDNINSNLINEIANSIGLVEPLVYVFDSSFVTGVVPDLLNIATVIPVYKREKEIYLAITDLFPF